MLSASDLSKFFVHSVDVASFIDAERRKRLINGTSLALYILMHIMKPFISAVYL
jgi:hypothetical protein